MRKLSIFTTLFVAVSAFGQTVTTFAGIPNGDPTTNYESRTSNVDLDDTYFAYPNSMCFDASGKMWLTERNKVRMITNSKSYIRGGNPGGPTLSEGYVNNSGTQATFRVPAGIVADTNGVLYICDAENHCIRQMDAYVNTSNAQAITTFAGANPPGTIPGYGTSGTADGTGSAARFNQPRGICIDASGNFYVADYLNFTIRKITPAGVVTTIAGKAEVEGTTDNSDGDLVRFGGPWGIAMLDDNHLVVTDSWNTNIRKVNINTGATTTIAGPTSGPSPSHVDGTLSEARFKAPKGVVVINGIIYVGDQNLIRAIDIANNTVTTFAGEKTTYSITDGEGANAAFTEIEGLATDGSGVIYVTENSGSVSSHVIRKVVINTLAPVADFSATKTNLVVNEKTTLSDISSGATITSRTWTISPSNYTIHSGDLNSESLELSFQITGFFLTKLNITNEYGVDSLRRESYFNISTTGSISGFNANNMVTVFPNPTSERLHIELAPQFIRNKTNLSLYDANGLLIKETEVVDEINTSELANGVYYLTVISDDLQAVKKFVVAH